MFSISLSTAVLLITGPASAKPLDRDRTMERRVETILVTGAEGFIGRHVVAALKGRARVVTPRRNAGGGRVDLLDPDAVARLIAAERPAIVIHLAWVTEHGAFWSSPLNAAWERASVALFRLACEHGARRIVGVGSCAEYDWATAPARFAEAMPLKPHSEYGAAKVRTAEGLAEIAASQGVEWAWGRVFFLFGEGEPAARLVPRMLAAVRDGESLDIGPGETERDFWDVRNLGAALAALARSTVTGPVNLASGEATRFDGLAAIVEQLAGTRGLIHPGRRGLGPGEPARLVADATRLREEVGFTDPVALKAGLADYWNALGG